MNRILDIIKNVNKQKQEIDRILSDVREARVEINTSNGKFRARSHCRFVLPLIHFIPDSLTYSAPEFLKRQCDRTLGKLSRAFAAVDELVYKDAKVPVQCPPGYSRLFFVFFSIKLVV